MHEGSDSGAAARSRLGLVLGVVGAYLATAFGLGNLYPFSVFDMYAGDKASSASRVVARDAEGHLDEVRAWTGWSCDPWPRLDLDACQREPPFYVVPYINREHEQYLSEHRGSPDGGEVVDLVAKVWWLDASGVRSAETCVIASCRARRR